MCAPVRTLKLITRNGVNDIFYMAGDVETAAPYARVDRVISPVDRRAIIYIHLPVATMRRIPIFRGAARAFRYSLLLVSTLVCDFFALSRGEFRYRVTLTERYKGAFSLCTVINLRCSKA